MSTRGPDGPAPGPGGSGRDAARSGGFGSGEFSGASAPGADEDSVTGAASGGGRHLRAVPDPVEQHDPEGFDVASRVAHRLSGLLPPARLGPGRGGRRRRRVTGEQRSGPRPDARDPQPLGAAVDELIAARGWRRQIGLRLVVQRWDELVGPSNARHSTPESYHDGVLVVRAESSTWASALRAIAPQLVAELNRRLGDGAVTLVNVRGPSAPSWHHGPRSVPGRGPRDTYG